MTDTQGVTSCSTTYLLDNYGNIVNAYYYEPFGKCWNVEHDPGRNTRFTGKEYEEDIGLYYFFARWYDPDAGRFVTRDPRSIVLGYKYCSNNPISFIDLRGFSAIRNGAELRKIRIAIENIERKTQGIKEFEGYGNKARELFQKGELKKMDWEEGTFYLIFIIEGGGAAYSTPDTEKRIGPILGTKEHLWVTEETLAANIELIERTLVHELSHIINLTKELGAKGKVKEYKKLQQ